MADEQVNQSLFTWVISTIFTGITAGLAWLGIHTKRLNELNTEVEVAKERENARDARISDIQSNIRDMKLTHKEGMTDIREKWDRQMELIRSIQQDSGNDHQKITSILMTQTAAITKHDEQIQLIERNVNFKVIKK